MSNPVITWAKSNPALAGVAVFGGGLVILWLTGALGGGGGSGGSDPNVAAYYNAVSQQGIAGDQLAIAQINAQASTTQALAADAAGVTVQQTWAGTSLAQTQSDNASAVSLAPYAAQTAIAGDLASVVANSPPITTTTQSHSNGFFGIGGGSSTSTTVSPNPAATAATQALYGLFSTSGHDTTGFVAGH